MTITSVAFQPSVDKKQVMELATISFLNEAVNVVFLGPLGVEEAIGSGMVDMED